LLLAIVIIAAVLLILRDRSRRAPETGASAAGGSQDALRILNERFAKGDIDPEDFKVRRDLLLGSA
jgi:uncharacterized membrane protein